MRRGNAQEGGCVGGKRQLHHRSPTPAFLAFLRDATRVLDLTRKCGFAKQGFMWSDLVADPSPSPSEAVQEADEGFSPAEIEAYVATLRILCALPPRVGLAVWRALCASPHLPPARALASAAGVSLRTIQRVLAAIRATPGGAACLAPHPGMPVPPALDGAVDKLSTGVPGGVGSSRGDGARRAARKTTPCEPFSKQVTPSQPLTRAGGHAGGRRRG